MTDITVTDATFDIDGGRTVDGLPSSVRSARVDTYVSPTPSFNGLLLARAPNIVVGNPFGRGLNGRISYRFHARDLQLVMGQAPRDVLVRFRVPLDG